MKKLVLLVPAAILTVGLMASQDAAAGDTVQRAPIAVNPAIFKLFTTAVKGTVDMSAAKNGIFAGMTCDKLGISATSQKQITPTCPAGQLCFSHPQWVHSQSKLGNGADANHCTYEILVPGGSAFTLSVGSQYNLCGGSGITTVTLKTEPGSITVPFGTTKEVDLAISAFNKECIN